MSSCHVAGLLLGRVVVSHLMAWCHPSAFPLILLPNHAYESVIPSSRYSSCPSIVPICASQRHRHYSGMRHCSVYCHYWLSPVVPSNFTGTLAGNRHCLTGIIEGPILYTRCHFSEKKSHYPVIPGSHALPAPNRCPGYLLGLCFFFDTTSGFFYFSGCGED